MIAYQRDHLPPGLLIDIDNISVVHLDSVAGEQRIKTLESRKFGRDAEHQFGINYRHAGIKAWGTDEGFLIGILLRDNI